MAYLMQIHHLVNASQIENIECHQVFVIQCFSSYCHSLQEWRPHEESNLDLRFRKPLFYPLNYGGEGNLRITQKQGFLQAMQDMRIPNPIRVHIIYLGCVEQVLNSSP